MLLQMAFILAIVGVVTEVMLVHGSKTIHRLYTKGLGPIKGVYWNTIGSFALSGFQGLFFGADGLVIAMAGAMSAGISQVYFVLEEAIEKATGHTTIYKAIQHYWEEFKQNRYDSIKKSCASFFQMMQDLWKVIKFVIKVITFPLWGYRAAKTHVLNAKAQVMGKMPNLKSNP